MEGKINKPRLVFFQWNHEDLPKFLQLHTQVHVKCLSEFFEVVSINKDCDYRHICETYQPDLTLFESGFKSTISKKITIKNTSAYPEIPKLGLLNGDGWCSCRVGFFSDMEHWGIKNFFTIATSTAEYTPEISENLFVWPNFIDSDIYHDYGHGKIIPILFNGSMIALYPWRQKIFKLLSNCYPILTFPHLGYENHSTIMIHGEQYARTINSSWLVPTCGTIVKEIVRKHFEIPGSKSCLITERTPILEAAGFVDMQNCVFVNEKDILSKINYLFENPDKLEKITNAGYQHVQSNHTFKQRDQIFQWYNLNKDLKPSQKIVQLNPFESLTVVDKSSDVKNTPIISDGLILRLLREGDEKLWAGNYNEAERFYYKCLNFIPAMSEPKLKLAICSLFKGNSVDAYRLVKGPIYINLGIYKALDSDPVEWAYLIISLLCQGKLNEAIIRIQQFPSLQHPELDRTRWVIRCLQYQEYKTPMPDNSFKRARYSIHQLPQLSFTEWIKNLCLMLKACQQEKYAERLLLVVSINEPSEIKKKSSIGISRLLNNYWLFVRISWLKNLNRNFESLNIPDPRPGLPPISELDFIIRLSRWAKIDSGKKILFKYISYLKSYFNKLAFSNVNKNEFFLVLQSYLKDNQIETILIISESDPTIWTKAFFINKKTKSYIQNIFFVKTLTDKSVPLKKECYNNNGLKSYNFFSNVIESYSLEFYNCLSRIKEENRIDIFDLILIDNSAFKDCIDIDGLMGAETIILIGINAFPIFQIKEKLILSLKYTLVMQNPLYLNGYGIFKKNETLAVIK